MSEKKEVAIQVWKQLTNDKWEHPDPRLSGIVLMMAANGFKPSKIAEMLGINLRLLKRFYKRELLNGASAVDQEIYNKLVARALNDESPKLALKATELLLKYKLKREKDDEDEPAPKEEGASVKGMVDPKKLTLDELRTLTALLEKGKIEGPRIVIDVKATKKDE